MSVRIEWTCGRCGSQAVASAYEAKYSQDSSEIQMSEVDTRTAIIRHMPSIDLGRLDMNCPNCVGDAAALRRESAVARGLALNAQADLERVRSDIVRDLRAKRAALVAGERWSWHWRIVGRSVLSTFDWIIEHIEEGEDE